MTVRDGICYAEPFPRPNKIVSAENVGDYLVKVCFNDGLTRLFDGRTLTGEVFAPLAEPAAFADWTLDYETLTWKGGEIDISPDYVLAHSTGC